MVKILLFLSGAAFGVVVSYFFMGNYDLLSSNKSDVVSLNKDVDFMENEKVKVSLPKGTRLTFKSQYDDVGEFSLDVIITDLSVIDKSSGDVMYFSDQ